MNESRIQLTLAFHHSRTYRDFIVNIRHLRSSSAGVLLGATRILVKRNPRPREITLLSHGILADFFFDVGQWIPPASVSILDFEYGPAPDLFVEEFMRSLKSCLQASIRCLEAPEDPETFHRFRLDIRAFRSLLKCVEKLDVIGLDDLRAKTKALANASNELRDADVRIALYHKFDEPIPVDLIEQRKRLSENAIKHLQDKTSDAWFAALHFIASSPMIERFTHRFIQYIEKQTKKTAKQWHKTKLKDDREIHALRIKLKMLSYGYSVLKSLDLDVGETAKSIKSIQSRLGDVRDLRSFFILPGLQQATRFRAVQALSSIENELEEMEIRY
jgi:CHAD domain-containing protein